MRRQTLSRLAAKTPFSSRAGGATVVDARMADEAAKLARFRDQRSACARQLGIPVAPLTSYRRAGVIADPTRAPAAARTFRRRLRQTPASADARQTDPPPATDRATRDPATSTPMGRAARDVEGRMLAILPDDRGRAGVRRARPAPSLTAACSRHCLLRASARCDNRLFRLPDGFYGLTTILLFVAFMTLARVRNPESLRYQAQASGVRSSA